MRNIVLTSVAMVAASVSAASAADLTWQSNPDWFPQVKQAYEYGRPLHSNSGAAMKLACPSGPQEKMNQTKTCGDATVKFLACGGSKRFVRMQGNTLYIGVCVADLDKVKNLK